MDEQVVKKYYILISILDVCTNTIKLLSKENQSFLLDSLYRVNKYLYRELLCFGINHIGEPEDNL